MIAFEQYHLKLAEKSETDIAMSFINQAKALLKSKGIDQWQSGYPDERNIADDILHQKGYFVMDGNDYVAYMCIDFAGEPAYDTLQGSWLNTVSSYGVVHRLAMNTKYRGKGAASVAFYLAESLMKRYTIRSFRADTDDENEVMKYLFSKHGFTCCGTVWFENSSKIAYEKLL